MSSIPSSKTFFFFLPGPLALGFVWVWVWVWVWFWVGWLALLRSAFTFIWEQFTMVAHYPLSIHHTHEQCNLEKRRVGKLPPPGLSTKRNLVQVRVEAIFNFFFFSRLHGSWVWWMERGKWATIANCSQNLMKVKAGHSRANQPTQNRCFCWKRLSTKLSLGAFLYHLD
jgi:hypothetical protein